MSAQNLKMPGWNRHRGKVSFWKRLQKRIKKQNLGSVIVATFSFLLLHYLFFFKINTIGSFISNKVCIMILIVSLTSCFSQQSVDFVMGTKKLNVDLIILRNQKNRLLPRNVEGR